MGLGVVPRVMVGVFNGWWVGSEGDFCWKLWSRSCSDILCCHE